MVPRGGEYSPEALMRNTRHAKYEPGRWRIACLCDRPRGLCRSEFRGGSPPNWRKPAATKEQEKLESDLGTNLDLPLREQGVAGLCCGLEQARRSIPRDSRILEHEAGRACAARNAVNGGRRVRCSNREHLGVYAGDVDVIEEVKRISANRKLPGLPDFELL